MSRDGNFDDYYKQLEGYQITKYMGTVEDEFGGRGFPRFLLTQNGHPSILLEVSTDPEGNEGGFLFIQDYISEMRKK